MIHSQVAPTIGAAHDTSPHQTERATKVSKLNFCDRSLSTAPGGGKMDEVTGAQLIAESLKAQVGTLQQQFKKKVCESSSAIYSHFAYSISACTTRHWHVLRTLSFVNLMLGPAESRVHVWDRWGSYY